MQILKLKIKFNEHSLLLVASHGHAEAIRELIAAHANIEAQDNNQCTSLHRAVRNGHTEVVKLLLEAHANVGARDNGGKTPLFYARMRKYTEAEQLLVQWGAQ